MMQALMFCAPDARQAGFHKLSGLVKEVLNERADLTVIRLECLAELLIAFTAVMI